MTGSPNPGTAKCPKCGAQFLAGARFCMVCGQTLVAPAAQIPQPATGQPVFISHAADDKAVAEKVCRLLEVERIRCWIAPRNINPRRDRSEQTIAAIESAPALVLILSANANASIFVPSEVERAFSNGRVLYVLRVEEVQPSRAIALFVSRSQWIDAWKPPLEDPVHVLAGAIRGLLSLPSATVVDSSRPRPGLLSRRRLVGLGRVGVGLAALATVALVGGLLFFASRSPGCTVAPVPATSATPRAASPSVSAVPQLTNRQPQFTSIGAMKDARVAHTATLLQDGRVLIAGGSDGTTNASNVTTAIASAELYDPKTGTFSATGSMLNERKNYTATLLQDGRVLVVGGETDSAALATAELYDPKTGTFSATGSMALARAFHTATLLRDGRVLIAGGIDNLALVASAEVCQP